MMELAECPLEPVIERPAEMDRSIEPMPEKPKKHLSLLASCTVEKIKESSLEKLSEYPTHEEQEEVAKLDIKKKLKDKKNQESKKEKNHGEVLKIKKSEKEFQLVNKVQTSPKLTKIPSNKSKDQAKEVNQVMN